jgi:hypothetical protein
MSSELEDLTVPQTKPPIFVVGASRSGTNLLRALLNKHSEIWMSPETHYFDDLRPRLSSGGTQPLDRAEREQCERYFLALSHRAYGQHGDPEESRIDRGELASLAAKLGGTGDSYFQALCMLRAELRGKPRWAEKTPRHVYRIDEMLDAFPEAKVVCLVRDPRAVIASYRDWHRAGPKRDMQSIDPTALAADRLRSKRSYNIVLMSLLWRGVVQASYRALRHHGHERVYIQRFERLADDPEGSVRELTAWLGLDYEEAMLDIPVVNSSYASPDSEEGVSKEPVDRWRARLSEREIGIIQHSCKSLMNELGYPLDPIRVSPFALAWAWGTAPFAIVRAAAQNRSRLGRVTQYVRRRGGSAFSRAPLAGDRQ